MLISSDDMQRDSERDVRVMIVSGQRIAQSRRILIAGTGAAHQIISAAAHDIVAGTVSFLCPFPIVPRKVVDVIRFRFLPLSRSVSAGVFGEVARPKDNKKYVSEFSSCFSSLF